MSAGVAWWEKTVEYMFVLKHLGSSVALPFAGVPEKDWGDLLLQGVSGLCLIEFKRTRAHIPSEYKKYPMFADLERQTLEKKDFRETFQGAFQELVDGHFGALPDEHLEQIRNFAKNGHQFVFGQADRGGFVLRCTPYSSIAEERDVPRCPSTEWGTDCQTMAYYLHFLAQMRARPPVENEGRQTGSTAMGVVIGVTTTGTVVIPAGNFLQLAMTHNLVPALGPAPSPATLTPAPEGISAAKPRLRPRG
ncbi:MAG: hypothetical protein E2591_27215 [Achromobacter sp.]|uniref:hypothetical protein n=1 Tax=Achromobacter sp. TaxID=134375 RepID=UPI0012CA514E|nr:hypothetical protein [Achromobacter sp.]MPS81765.1 hypothetical protein [Achromobacter sp.]